ncbi:hypothetical protein BH11PSE3_BH11PSE3_15490 [soil metagenome]
MARKLKTYTTSGGFFDLAIAAPSMKAALEAWGARNNLFQHGFAQQSEDSEVIAATMAKPGVVLRRPVGSDGAFSENAELPTSLATTPVKKLSKPAARKKVTQPAPTDDKAMRRAAESFEKEQRRRDAERRREEEARQKARDRQDRAVAAAEAALEQAEREHRSKAQDIEKARAAVDRKAEAEDARWKKAKDQLDEALRKARSVTYLRPV